MCVCALREKPRESITSIILLKSSLTSVLPMNPLQIAVVAPCALTWQWHCFQLFHHFPTSWAQSSSPPRPWWPAAMANQILQNFVFHANMQSSSLLKSFRDSSLISWLRYHCQHHLPLVVFFVAHLLPVFRVASVVRSSSRWVFSFNVLPSFSSSTQL